MSEALLAISYEDLCQIEGIERELVVEIVEYGIVLPINKTTDKTANTRSSETIPDESLADTHKDQWWFETSSVLWIKKAVRLHLDLEIDWIAVAIVIDLMRQKQELGKQYDSIQRRLTRLLESDKR